MRIDITSWIQEAWAQTKIRSQVRESRETSAWITSEEMGVFGICAEAAERSRRGLSVHPAFELTQSGQTGVPDIDGKWPTEIKTLIWACGPKAEQRENGGHTWVSTETTSQYLVVYSVYRCDSWPPGIKAGNPKAREFMDKCAINCGYPHFMISKGWLPISAVRTHPLVSGKGLRGQSYEVPVSNLRELKRSAAMMLSGQAPIQKEDYYRQE